MPDSVVVTIDVPDPDNFFMALRTVEDWPNHCVAIVLSPRPVSFAAIPYGLAFNRLKVLGIRNVIGRIDGTKTLWIENADPGDRGWFYIDEEFRDPAVQEDTDLYLTVSKLRLARYLRDNHIKPSQYRIYTQTINETVGIKPGTHHAMHKPDFAYGFNDMLLEQGAWKDINKGTAGLGEDEFSRFRELLSEAEAKKGSAKSAADLYLKIMGEEADFADGSKRSHQRRSDTRLLCRVYAAIQARELGCPEFGDLNELIDWHKATKAKPMLYIGGPFNEANQIINELGHENIGPVIAMAGASHGKSNLFDNQFNIHVDPESAKSVLSRAAKKEINLTLIPTECVKGTAYQLSSNELMKFNSEPIIELYNQWSALDPIAPFDILAAMAVTTYIYKDMLRSVDFTIDKEGTFVFSNPREAKPGPGLKMGWNEPKMKKNEKGEIFPVFDENPLMQERRPYLLKQFELTLTPPSKTEP